MLNIELIGDKILVEVDDEVKNPSGLIISKSSDPGEVKTGKVVAVGPGRTENGQLQDMKTMLGDTIWYQYGNKILIEGKPYVLVTESGDVIGIHMAPERN